MALTVDNSVAAVSGTFNSGASSAPGPVVHGDAGDLIVCLSSSTETGAPQLYSGAPTLSGLGAPQDMNYRNDFGYYTTIRLDAFVKPAGGDIATTLLPPPQFYTLYYWVKVLRFPAALYRLVPGQGYGGRYANGLPSPLWTTVAAESVGVYATVAFDDFAPNFGAHTGEWGSGIFPTGLSCTPAVGPGTALTGTHTWYGNANSMGAPVFAMPRSRRKIYLLNGGGL